MCIAIVKPSGVELPEREILKVCFKNNPDGAGFAYNRNGKNYLHKGYFTFAEFYTALESCHIKTSEAALIHFRVATHGNIDRQTCHPFLITGCYDDMKITHLKTSGNIMIHNGMLNLYENDKSLSDSMILSKQLYEMNLDDDFNKVFIELALQNNDKNKINRLGILYSDNRTEIFGFKEPWENVNGCLFSNKSYQKTFTRGYKSQLTDKVIEDKFNYDENEIQSSKVEFCHNKKLGCDNLSKYIVRIDDTKYDEYCEDCICNVDYFNCRFCEHSFYKEYESPIKRVCKSCYKANEFFLYSYKCSCGNKANVKAVDGDVNKFFCKKCASEQTFVCSECNKRFTLNNESKIKNLCVNCYLTKHDECFYCKKRTNLIRTSYSTLCTECIKTRNAKKCFLCGRMYLYSENKIGKLNFCTKCVTKFEIEQILNNFKTFELLSSERKNKLLELIKTESDEIKEKIIHIYDDNDFVDRIYKNYKESMNLMTNNGKKE